MTVQDPNHDNDGFYIHWGSLRMGASGKLAVIVLTALIVGYFIGRHIGWV